LGNQERGGGQNSLRGEREQSTENNRRRDMHGRGKKQNQEQNGDRGVFVKGRDEAIQISGEQEQVSSKQRAKISKSLGEHEKKRGEAQSVAGEWNLDREARTENLGEQDKKKTAIAKKYLGR